MPLDAACGLKSFVSDCTGDCTGVKRSSFEKRMEARTYIDDILDASGKRNLLVKVPPEDVISARLIFLL